MLAIVINIVSYSHILCFRHLDSDLENDLLNTPIFTLGKVQICMHWLKYVTGFVKTRLNAASKVF